MFLQNRAILAPALFVQSLLAAAIAPEQAAALVHAAVEGDAGALARLKQSAERQAEPLYRLGTLAFEGRLVRKDDALAADLFERAAAKGHAPAQNAFGCMLQTGLVSQRKSWKRRTDTGCSIKRGEESSATVKKPCGVTSSPPMRDIPAASIQFAHDN